MGHLVKDEHFLPEEGVTIDEYLERGERTAVHHLIRYRWAEAAIEELNLGGPVLDVACGAGYGSYGIARRFPSLQVIGGDYDSTAIAHARAHYSAPNLSYVEMDVTRWDKSVAEAKYGCVISFDTLEHIGHREIMMQKVVEGLLPDGVLLLSTPVRSRAILNPGWEHHKIEYSRAALYDFLRRYFHEVLAPDLGTLPCAEIFEHVNRKEVFYLLRMNPVLCRNPIRIEFGR